MKNLLNSFPILNENLVEKCLFKVETCDFKYIRNNENRLLSNTIVEGIDNLFFIDDEYGVYNPENDNLMLHSKIVMKNKNVLFDEEIGIAGKNDKLGIILTWYCKKTKQIYSSLLKMITFDDENTIEIEYEMNIPKGEISQEINIRYSISMQESNTNSIYATIPGTILGVFQEDKYILEGEGSIFPIEIFEDSTKPLWYATINYDDLNDEFCKENLCLRINRKHNDFKFLNDQNSNMMDNPLFKEILADFFVICFQSIIEDNRYTIEEVLENDYEENTIGNAIKYWLNMMDVKTSSIVNMMVSVRNCIDRL